MNCINRFKTGQLQNKNFDVCLMSYDEAQIDFYGHSPHSTKDRMQFYLINH